MLKYAHILQLSYKMKLFYHNLDVPCSRAKRIHDFQSTLDDFTKVRYIPCKRCLREETDRSLQLLRLSSRTNKLNSIFFYELESSLQCTGNFKTALSNQIRRLFQGWLAPFLMKEICYFISPWQILCNPHLPKQT